MVEQKQSYMQLAYNGNHRILITIIIESLHNTLFYF